MDTFLGPKTPYNLGCYHINGREFFDGILPPRPVIRQNVEYTNYQFSGLWSRRRSFLPIYLKEPEESAMLQKIVFQDNIYQLSRSIDTVYEGLMLDLSGEYFFDKTIDDLLFFDVSIQKIYRQIQANEQVSLYISILQALNSCQNRYIRLVDSVIQGKTAMKDEFAPLVTKLTGIATLHGKLRSEMIMKIQKNDKNDDSRDIVSQNELSELLNF
jgi:hypothetical protein